jgi:ClpP class serine protease
MNDVKFLSLFSRQPWAMSVDAWRSLLASVPSLTHPSARDMRAKAAAAPSPMAVNGARIGVMRISGPLVKGLDAEEAYWYGCTSYDSIHEGAEKVLKEGINTLVVHLDSPGGMVCGLAEAAARLQDLREAGVSLIAYSDTMMCSAAYWLGAACDEIITSPSAFVGSIGCICMAWDDAAFFDKIGIKPMYFVNEGSEAKLYGREGLAWTPEAKASFQASVDSHGEEFKSFLDEHRSGLARVDMNGDAWFASQAPAGYVDHMEFPTTGGRARPFGTVSDLLTFLASPVGV